MSISFSPVLDTGSKGEKLPVQDKVTVPYTGESNKKLPVQCTDINSLIRRDSKFQNTERTEMRLDTEVNEMIEGIKVMYGISRSKAIRVAVRLLHAISKDDRYNITLEAES